MRTFACKSLGNNCTWKHIARTEELLADVVASISEKLTE
jgi:predicted small metal-binding protein